MKNFQASEYRLEHVGRPGQKLPDAGIHALEAHEAALREKEEARRRLYAYAPAHLLLRKEFDELFDTTPDLTGVDLDSSRFIRSGEERDLHVFGLEIGPEQPLPQNYKPHRRELCAVPFLKARDRLCDPGFSTLKPSKRAWVWDWLDGEWKSATHEALLLGRIVCVAADSGGYRSDRGFDAGSSAPVLPVARPAVNPATHALEEADDQQPGLGSGGQRMTMQVHILRGSAPAPPANYLKAPGILRLVGERSDTQARARWDGEHFCLLTKLSKEALETFFLEQDEPTPLLSP